MKMGRASEETERAGPPGRLDFSFVKPNRRSRQAPPPHRNRGIRFGYRWRGGGYAHLPVRWPTSPAPRTAASRARTRTRQSDGASTFRWHRRRPSSIHTHSAQSACATFPRPKWSLMAFQFSKFKAESGRRPKEREVARCSEAAQSVARTGATSYTQGLPLSGNKLILPLS